MVSPLDHVLAFAIWMIPIHSLFYCYIFKFFVVFLSCTVSSCYVNLAYMSCKTVILPTVNVSAPNLRLGVAYM